jgi:hypothetical protein
VTRGKGEVRGRSDLNERCTEVRREEGEGKARQGKRRGIGVRELESNFSHHPV